MKQSCIKSKKKVSTMVEQKSLLLSLDACIELGRTHEHMVSGIMQRHPIKNLDEDKSPHLKLYIGKKSK